MKSKSSLFAMMQQCLDTLQAPKTAFALRLLILVPLTLFSIMILIITLLEQPGAIEGIACATAAVLTAPSLPLALALFIGGGVFAAGILSSGRRRCWRR